MYDYIVNLKATIEKLKQRGTTNNPKRTKILILNSIQSKRKHADKGNRIRKKMKYKKLIQMVVLSPL